MGRVTPILVASLLHRVDFTNTNLRTIVSGNGFSLSSHRLKFGLPFLAEFVVAFGQGG